MKTVSKGLIAFSFLLFFLYLSLPNADFPQAPSDSLQSAEPADLETPFRRAYFTNFTREEVLTHYNKYFSVSYYLNREIKLPLERLNYPPEEAQTIIRDQTRSTFLEELVRPFRESLFINGFEPKDEKDAIFIEGRSWRQKIIVRLIPSRWVFRIIVLTGVYVISIVIIKEWLSLFRGFLQKR